MAWTQTDLDAINAAIASGATRVRFQTHEVEYQTANELLRVRDAIKAELDPSSSNNRVLYAEYGSGY